MQANFFLILLLKDIFSRNCSFSTQNTSQSTELNFNIYHKLSCFHILERKKETKKEGSKYVREKKLTYGHAP